MISLYEIVLICIHRASLAGFYFTQKFERDFDELLAAARFAAGADDLIVALWVGLAIRDVTHAAIGELSDQRVLER